MFADEASFRAWFAKKTDIKHKSDALCFRDGFNIPDWLDWLRLVNDFWTEYGVAYVPKDIQDAVTDTITHLDINHDDFLAGRFPLGTDSAAIARLEAFVTAAMNGGDAAPNAS